MAILMIEAPTIKSFWLYIVYYSYYKVPGRVASKVATIQLRVFDGFWVTPQTPKPDTFCSP